MKLRHNRVLISQDGGASFIWEVGYRVDSPIQLPPRREKLMRPFCLVRLTANESTTVEGLALRGTRIAPNEHAPDTFELPSLGEAAENL